MQRDVVIVGGGPAGLAAALVLGRSRKHVTVFDANEPRNAVSSHVYGLFGRDGIPPADLRRIAREQLMRYPTVEVLDARVLAIGPAPPFVVRTELGEVEARRILLATGLVDELPALPGLRACWGHTVLNCPYCHGWESRDERDGAWLRSPKELDFPLLLRGWTDDVIVFLDGRPLDDATREDYARAGIRTDPRRVLGVRAEGTRLRAVQLEDGEVERDRLFLHPHQRQVPLVAALGLRMHDSKSVWIDEHAQTSVRGIFAAGDLVTSIHGATLAAASGTDAAYKLNTLLTKDLVRENR